MKNNENVKKFAYIGIFGAPNVGKSTLVNGLIGKKCSIVSPKPHTTQSQIIGVLNYENTQVAFIDTPGVSFKRGNPRFLESESKHNFIMLDVGTRSMSLDYKVVEHLSGIFRERSGSTLGIILNKIDLSNKLKLLPIIGHLSQYSSEIFPISAKTGEGVDSLFAHILSLADEGNWIFENYTDKSINFIATEEIREKLLVNTHKEVPFTSKIKIDQINDSEDVMEFYATIAVEKDNHKGIIIGRGGQMLRKIGESARLSLQAIFSKRVRLFLQVTVQHSNNANSV